MLRTILLLLIGFAIVNPIEAQKEHDYTDHRPAYRKWLDSYIIDKIQYTPKSTIFYFRFVCNNVNSGGAIFFPPGGESPWYLKGRNVKKDFDITAVKNVKRNGVVVKKKVVRKKFHSDVVGATGHTVYSCEVHFPRLPDDLTTADLIEGRGQEYNRRHFNCFNVNLKTWKDKTLGTHVDSKKKIEDFESKYNIHREEEKPKKDEFKDKDDYKYDYTAKELKSKGDIGCDKTIRLGNVQFHDNSSKFKGEIAAKEALSIVFNFMKENPKSKLMLYGHTDVFGSEEKNMEISKSRVIKIQRWLTMYGIKATRIDYKWYGSQKPLVPEGDISNRRVEIKLSCKD